MGRCCWQTMSIKFYSKHGCQLSFLLLFSTEMMFPKTCSIPVYSPLLNFQLLSSIIYQTICTHRLTRDQVRRNTLTSRKAASSLLLHPLKSMSWEMTFSAAVEVLRVALFPWLGMPLPYPGQPPASLLPFRLVISTRDRNMFGRLYFVLQNCFVVCYWRRLPC